MTENAEQKMKEPFINEEKILNEVAHESFLYPNHAPTTTVCVLVTHSGFSIIGASACINPDNFDLKLGKDLARNDALRQLGRLMAYELMKKQERDSWQVTETGGVHF